ncbi:MAG: D-alanine--D-alanine ligase [Candidatus Omnitrophota bacterium]|nr:MAG: D-alanine--D-alanine ligase [Candidatus Omnitrophota bacterium]
MKIVILAGGDSSEREISLRSGKEVFNALKKKGHELFLLDPVEENFCEKILKIKPDCVFIALHGGKGEGGIIQGFLETLNIPYTGSDTLSSAICLNKLISKKILKFHKIPTPDFIVVDKSFSPEKIPFKYPVVVKPASQGSTIGIKIVEKESELYKAIKEAFNYDNEVFIEKYIDGKEVTVSIIGNENPKVMPIIEIITPTGFYDYKAKYTPGGSIHKIPPDLPENVIKKVEDVAIKAYKAVKCSGFARIEIIVSKKGTPYILDINTIPGLTKTSLFPDSAKAAGIPFEELCEKIINLALEKWKKKQ